MTAKDSILSHLRSAVFYLTFDVCPLPAAIYEPESPPMRCLLAYLLFAASPAVAADFPKFEAQTIDPHVGDVCYAVKTADVDGDKRPDVVAATEDAVVWFATQSAASRLYGLRMS